MLNKVFLIGNVGKEPEIKTFKSGDKVANFSLATTESWKDKKTNEWVKKTEWHNIVVFGEGLVNLIERSVKKGSKIYIEGKLATRKWAGSDGKNIYATEVILKGFGGTIKLLDPKTTNEPKATPQSAIDDDIPFN